MLASAVKMTFFAPCTKYTGRNLSEVWPSYTLSNFVWTKIISHFWVTNTLPSVIFGCIFIVLIYKIQHQKEKPPSVHVLGHWGKS